MSTKAQEREAIDHLSTFMIRKLRQNSNKPFWRDKHPDTIWNLLEGLDSEIAELKEAVLLNIGSGGTPEYILYECADVANYAAMIADLIRWKNKGKSAR